MVIYPKKDALRTLNDREANAKEVGRFTSPSGGQRGAVPKCGAMISIRVLDETKISSF